MHIFLLFLSFAFFFLRAKERVDARAPRDLRRDDDDEKRRRERLLLAFSSIIILEYFPAFPTQTASQRGREYLREGTPLIQ